MATRILIASTVLGSDTASITFSDIPQTFDDLLLVVSARSDRAANARDAQRLRINGDDASNYTGRLLRGSGGGSPTSSTLAETSAYLGYTTGAGATANTFASTEVLLTGYSSSGAAKSFSCSNTMETNDTLPYLWVSAHLWSGTAAVTDLLLYPGLGANLAAGSSAYLYGLKRS